MWSWRPSARGATPVPLRARAAIVEAAKRLARVPESQRERLCIAVLRDLVQIDECSLDREAPAWARAALATGISGVIVNEECVAAAFLAPAEWGPGLVLRIARDGSAFSELDLHLLQLFALQVLPALGGGRLLLLTHVPARGAEVLSLLASGAKEADICRFINISRHTLNTHVRQLFRRFGVQTRAELLHIRAIHDAFSVPLTKVCTTGLPNLTPRQRQIVEHLITGSSEKEAAASLGISPHTVHDSLKVLHRRLGVRSRAELLMAVGSAR